MLLEAQTKPFLENRDNVSALTDKATEVKKILDNHIYWTNFFDFLEKHIIKDVYFVNFSGDINGEYSIEAVGQEYKNIVEQVEAFRKDELTEKAEVREGRIATGRSGNGIKFNLELTINPKIFKKTD